MPERSAVDEEAFVKPRANVKRMQGRKAIRQCVAEMEDFYEHAPCGCHTLDKNDFFICVNDTELTWLGYTRRELLRKKRYTEIFKAPGGGSFENEFALFKERGWMKDKECEMICKGGSVRTVLLSGTAIYSQEGDYVMSRSTAYDITGRKLAEQKLGLLSQALNTVREAAFITDENARFRFVNEEACRALGYSREELLTLRVYDIDADFSVEHWKTHWAEVKERRVRHFETHHRAKDGRVFPVEITCNLFEYENRCYHLALVRDITERKQVLDQSNQVRDYLQMQITRMPFGVIVWDKDLRVQAWNPAAENIFGFAESEALGKHPYELIVTPELRPTIGELWNRLLQGDKTAFTENDNITKDGRAITCFWTNTPLRTSEGAVAGILSLVQDITERKRDEGALRRMNRELRAITECHQVLMRATDEPTLLRDICRIVCDEAGYRMAWVGYSENDEAKTVRPVAWAGFEGGYLTNVGIVWADTEAGHGPTGTAIRTGQCVFIDDFKTDRSVAFWRERALKRGYRCNISMPLKDENGTVFGAFSIYSSQPNAFRPEEVRLLAQLTGDLAFGIRVLRGRKERKRAEAEIRKLNAELEQRVLDRTRELRLRTQELETIFNTVPVGLAIAHNATGSHILGNAALEEMAGVPPGSEVSLTASEHPPYYARDASGKKIPGLELPMQRACRGEVITGEIVEIVRADGTVYAVFSNSRPILDEAGQPRGAVGAFMDITAQKRTEEEIRKLNEQLQRRASELEAANKELEAFSYSASHDLRTPLRSIDGFSRILLEENAARLGDEGREQLEQICIASERMNRLIDGLLMLARITRAELQRKTVNLSALAAEIADELLKQDPKRRVQFHIEPDLRAQGDPDLLRILLNNLLGNAWKFTGRQAIANIEFGKTRRNGARAFFVRDNGVGLDMKYAHKLFGAFERLHQSRDFPGTGIGLATAQRVINRHGGSIWVESEVDRGAAFYFTLAGN